MATDLANLRRARSRAHFALKQAEMQVESYAYKVAEIEAAIQAIAPDLNLPPRFYKPNPVFARNELPRLAIDILRHAGVHWRPGRSRYARSRPRGFPSPIGGRSKWSGRAWCSSCPGWTPRGSHGRLGRGGRRGGGWSKKGSNLSGRQPRDTPFCLPDFNDRGLSQQEAADLDGIVIRVTAGYAEMIDFVVCIQQIDAIR
jgi:hypothetical protein